MQPALSIREMMNRYARDGRVVWIGIRPQRRAAVETVAVAEITEAGLAGDYRDKPGKRAVTLIQWEHLAVVGSFLGQTAVAPERLRRNIAVVGINLLGLRNRAFEIGGARLLGTGLCAPCSRMEEELGPGGYSAMRAHGGITAEVLIPGMVRLGDPVRPV